MVEPKNELQRNALVEARHKELESYQRALDKQWLDSRMGDGGMGRSLAQIKTEAEMEKEYQERTDHAAIVNEKARKETALGIAVAKVKHDEDCELLRRHYLREHDPSLRTLMKKLQAGYVCRDQRQQILHNEYRRLQEKAEELHSNRVLTEALYSDQQAKEREEKEKIKRSKTYCKELQQQMVNRQLQKQCEYEDRLIEKKMLDDIMRTISDEDMKELAKKRLEVERSRHEMETFRLARDAWRLKQKELLVRGERALQAQADVTTKRADAIVEQRLKKQQLREEINKTIADKIMADEAEKEERQTIIKMLQEQEYLEKNVNDDLRERRKSEMTKRETKEALTTQMEERKRLHREQRERENDFRKTVEDKLHQDEQKEKEKELKKREQKKQYAIELKKQIAEHERRRKKENELEENRAKSVFDYHRDWSQEVSKEREKIVQDHAPHLLGFLQAGVISPSDLKAVKVGANMHQHLANLDIESLESASKQQRHAKCNPQCMILREY